MIVVRFQRANGPTAVLRIEDDSQLQRVMDLANNYFGDPAKVISSHAPIVALPSKKTRKRGRK